MWSAVIILSPIILAIFLIIAIWFCMSDYVAAFGAKSEEEFKEKIKRANKELTADIEHLFGIKFKKGDKDGVKNNKS